MKALVLCAVILGSSVTAHADPRLPWRVQMEEAERPPPIDRMAEREPERRWYGWQTLAIDLPSVVLMLTAAATETTPMIWTGFGLSLIGPPSVHLANARPRTAAVSLALRAGVSLLLLGGGMLARHAFDDTPDSSRAATGVGIILVLLGIGGAAAAVTIDAAMLAFEEVETSSPMALRLLPWIDFDQGRAGAWMAWSL